MQARDSLVLCRLEVNVAHRRPVIRQKRLCQRLLLRESCEVLELLREVLQRKQGYGKIGETRIEQVECRVVLRAARSRDVLTDRAGEDVQLALNERSLVPNG